MDNPVTFILAACHGGSGLARGHVPCHEPPAFLGLSFFLILLQVSSLAQSRLMEEMLAASSNK